MDHHVRAHGIPAFIAWLTLLGCGGTPEEANPTVLQDATDQTFVRPPPPAGCDGKALPTEAPCTIHEAYGVFVAREGLDTNLGTRLAPLRTLATGLRIASLSKRRLYVCAESFDEPLVLQNAVSVFGYFDCKKSWRISATERARIAPHAYPVAARATDITRTTRIEGLEIASADGTNGGSSIALIAVRSSGLVFARTRFAAGRGADGAAGIAPIGLQNSAPANGEPGAAVQLGECDQTCSAARQRRPLGGSNVCSGSRSFVGGPGGNGARAGRVRYRAYEFADLPLCYPRLGITAGPMCYYPDPGEALEQGDPRVESVQTARGASFGITRLVGANLERERYPAHAGAPGANGKSGRPGILGMFSANGYAGGDGEAGDDGAPGQGGGGGTAQVPDTPVLLDNMLISSLYAAQGGGGGAGGCPGLGGTGGAGGGASVAIIAIDSELSVDASCSIEANTGGIGGPGSFGSAPTAGGRGADPNSLLPETAGAPGGPGGKAGPSGPGAGGPSIGIAWHGPRPRWSSTPLLGVPAPPQPERRDGDRVIPMGTPGVAAAELAF